MEGGTVGQITLGSNKSKCTRWKYVLRVQQLSTTWPYLKDSVQPSHLADMGPQGHSSRGWPTCCRSCKRREAAEEEQLPVSDQRGLRDHFQCLTRDGPQHLKLGDDNRFALP